MLDYLILSDLHLESSVCQHDKILEVLSQKSKNYIFEEQKYRNKTKKELLFVLVFILKCYPKINVTSFYTIKLLYK